MSKPSTPVRRSKVGPGRPGSAGGEIPLTASMEVLTPDPCVPPLMAVLDVGRSSDILGAVNGGKPRTPGSAPLSRARSTDGRRSGMAAPHEVIPLNSTTSKSLSANHIGGPHPLPVPLPPPSVSPACSVVGSVGTLTPQSPYAAGAGGGVQASAQRHPDVSLSQVSSRFNPVTEGEDDASGPYDLQLRQQQQAAGSTGGPQPQRGQPDMVLVAVENAAAVAQRAAAAGAGGRRYGESVDASQQQLLARAAGVGREGEPSGGAAASGEGRGGGSAAGSRFGREESDIPGTPGSVASGRIGGIFFTDLHRSFASGRLRASAGVGDSQDLTGALHEEGEGDGEGPAQASRRSARASTLISRLNPMRSPSASSSEQGDDEDDAFAEYAGEATSQDRQGPGAAAAVAAIAAAANDDLQTSTSVLTEYDNPLQTPQDSRLATPLLPLAAAAAPDDATASRGSLLHVIRDLYVTDPEPQPSAPEEEVGSEKGTSRPATAAAATEGAQADGVGEQEDADEAAALAASRAAVAALAARVDSRQSERRSELGEYMSALQELKDDSGGRLVELPADWGVMLERLFRQRRSEFATLEGWLGPRRFEDLPINQLPSDHPDPRVEEGLMRIRELDSVLNDKLIAALISHRETFPDQWAEQERKRLERHSKVVEEALKRERQKRLRAARISRAVTSLDAPAAAAAEGSVGRESEASMRSLATQPSTYSRLYTLKPEEEALVEAVMQRNDDEGVAINPFDLESAAAYGGAAAAPSGRFDSASACGDADGILTDPDDIELDLGFLLPSSSAGSCCPTPSAASARTPMPRPLSARLADLDGGASGSRPGSSSSTAAGAMSLSLSLPGTSIGVGGGLSPIAAAALRGHPALLAALGPRASAADGVGLTGGLLPSRVYEDPRAAARALRAINARLAAFESEHLWDESGSLADFKNLSEPPQRSPLPPQQAPLGGPGAAPPSGGGGGKVAGGGGPIGQPPRPQTSPPRSVRSAAGGAAPSLSGVSVTAGGQRDYLREERLAKELASRERDLDAALRSLKTGEVVRLGEATLKALVEQCRRLQELNEHRRRIEEAEAAARRAQQQRQQLMANSPRGRASESAKTPKGSHAAPRSNGSSSNGTSVSTPTGSGKGAGPSAWGQAAPAPGDGGAAGGAASLGRTSASASGAGRASVSAGAASAVGGGGAQPRQNSAGSSGASRLSGATTAITPSSARPPGGGGGSGPPASRRASDPTSSAAAASTLPSTSTAPSAARGASSSGAAAVGGGGSSKGVRTSTGAGPATTSGVNPPKLKPGGKASATTPSTSSAVPSSFASLVGPLDLGLPPPPPPPPP